MTKVAMQNCGEKTVFSINDTGYLGGWGWFLTLNLTLYMKSLPDGLWIDLVTVASSWVEEPALRVWAEGEPEPGRGSLGTLISRLRAIRVGALLLIRSLQGPQ